MSNTSIIRPTTKLMLEAADQIDMLCADIKKLGITYFSHTRIFDNGGRIDINNNAPMIEEYYFGKDKVYEYYTPEINPRASQNNVVMLDNLEDNPSFQFLRVGYNIAHMLVKIDKNDQFCDVWNFGTTCDNKSISNLYSNNLDILTLFTFYYREQCHDLIKECTKDPIIIQDSHIIESATHLVTDEALLQNARESLESKTKRYYLSGLFGEVYLTQKEIQCCRWLYCGKTAEEIGIILGCSNRTIEKHIANIHAKLGTASKTQLINYLSSCSLF